MLSYQHIYHAGNFADVQKHAVLVKLLQLLARKPQKFAYIDTHAGRGLYDLRSAEAQKVGEFNTGILPFWAKRFEASPISDYLALVATFNHSDALHVYPGSAKIAQALARATDRLHLIERHPGELKELQTHLTGANVRIEQTDGFQFLATQLPPAERYGLVLVDPSYELKNEYADLPRQLQQAYKKWMTGQYVVWYPMLAAEAHRQMLTDLRKTSIKNVLVSEITLDQQTGMYGTGVIIINPPFGFETTLKELTQYIAAHLPGKAQGRVYWLDNQPINPETGLV